MLLTFPDKESLLRKINENPFGDSYLIVANFKSLAGWNLIPLRQLTILLGPNSAGKSSVHEAFNIVSLLTTKLSNKSEFEALTKYLFDSKRDGSTEPIVGFSIPYQIDESLAQKWMDLAVEYKLENSGGRFDYEANKSTRMRSQDKSKFPAISKVLYDKKFNKKLKSKTYTLLIKKLNIEEFQFSVYFDDIESARWNGLYSQQFLQIDRKFAEELIPNSLLLDGLDPESDYVADFVFNGGTDICPWPEIQSRPTYLYSGKEYEDDDKDSLVYEDEIFGILTVLFQLPIKGFIENIEGYKTTDVRQLSSDWVFCYFRHNELVWDKKKFAQNSFAETNNVFPKEIFHSEITRIINRKKSSESDLHKLNTWLQEPAFLGTQYQLKVDLKACIPVNDLNKNFSLVDHFKESNRKKTHHKPFGDSTVEFLGRGYLIDAKNRELSFDEVGTGFSQIIPILSALAVDKTLIYKQPEVHLHPKLQSKVADCFVELINQNRNKKFGRKVRLIETHSEHFVLRILKRLRASYADELFHSSLTVYPQDLSILYFKPEEDRSQIYQIRVTENGGFIDRWPEGFFDDRDEDLL